MLILTGGSPSVNVSLRQYDDHHGFWRAQGSLPKYGLSNAYVTVGGGGLLALWANLDILQALAAMLVGQPEVYILELGYAHISCRPSGEKKAELGVLVKQRSALKARIGSRFERIDIKLNPDALSAGFFV